MAFVTPSQLRIVSRTTMGKESIDISIIWRKFHGQLNDKEEKQLSDWLSEDPAHRTYYHNMMKRFRSEDEEEPAISTEDAWSNMQQQIQNKQATPPRTKRRVVGIYYWAAACAAILLVSVFSWMPSETVIDLPVADEIKPGSEKAVLITGTGQSIELKDRSLTIEKNGVKTQSDGKTLQYASTGEGKSTVYEQNTLMIPRGGKYGLVLSDGTKVYLNSETTLTYPVGFAQTRTVSLQGEAYFEVAKNEKPFIVNVAGSQVRVLGTHFNITSYPEQDEVVTTLVEGKVNVKSAASQVVTLTPGEQSVYSQKRQSLHKQMVDTDLYTGWVNDLFVFEDQTLDEIMGRLSRWYNVDYFFVNPSRRSVRFSGEIERFEEIGNILRLIEKTQAVDIEIKGRTIIIN